MDSPGLSALPSGSRSADGVYEFNKYYGDWWSSTEFSSMEAWFRMIGYYDGVIGQGGMDKKSGLSVRCLRY